MTRYPFYRRLGGPHGSLDGCAKYRPHRDSIPDRPACGKLLYQLHYPCPQRGICKMFQFTWCMELFYICHCWSDEPHINSKNVFFFHTPSHIHEHPHMWFNVTLYEKEEILIIQGTDALSLPSIPIPLFSSFTVVCYRIQIRIECGHNKQTQKKYKYAGSNKIKNKPLLKLKTKLWMGKACNMQDNSSQNFQIS